jgi:hypothetical protein
MATLEHFSDSPCDSCVTLAAAEGKLTQLFPRVPR